MLVFVVVTSDTDCYLVLPTLLICVMGRNGQLLTGRHGVCEYSDVVELLPGQSPHVYPGDSSCAYAYHAI